MSDAAAAVAAPVATPAAPPAVETAAPAVPSGKDKARNLAGQFISGVTPKVEAAPAVEAEPEAPADPETEPVVEDKKPDELDEKAAALEAAKAEKAKLDKAFREHRRRQKQEKDFIARRREIEAQRAAEQAELRADSELKTRDPHAWLEKHGYDIRDVAKRAIEQESITPEQRAAKEAEQKASEKLTAMERELEELRQERNERKRQEAMKVLTDEATTAWAEVADQYPTLRDYYTPEEIAEATNQVRLDYVQRTKREPPLEDVFAFIEKNAAAHAKRFGSKRTDPATGSTERATVGGEQPPKTRATGRPQVTNRTSATRASPPAPLTRDEKRARAAAKAAELISSRS